MRIIPGKEGTLFSCIFHSNILVNMYIRVNKAVREINYMINSLFEI